MSCLVWLFVGIETKLSRGTSQSQAMRWLISLLSLLILFSMFEMNLVSNVVMYSILKHLNPL